MNPALVAAVLLALIAFSTAVGLIWRARNGRIKLVAAESAGAHRVDIPEVPIAGRATLLQFSNEMCTPCVPTRRVLGQIAASTDGVRHIDLDLTHRPDLTAKFNVLQAPTTLILDNAGVIRARIGGAPRIDEVRAALATILAA